MGKKLKQLPVIIMLIAGATTGVITYALNYEGKTALLILLGVLLFFYIAGSLFSNMLMRFEKEVEEKELAYVDEEGKVVEKEPGSEQEEESATQTASGYNVKDAGEQ